MAAEIKVPTLGESVTEAVIAKWLKAEGDSVAADEALVELETDKVTLEVNAPEAGVLSEIAAQEGETVEVGALLGRIGAGNGKAAAVTEAARTEAKQESAPETAAEAPAETEAPAAAKPAAETRPSGGSGKRHDVPVPTLGESVTEAVVSKWLKKPGDAVSADEAIAELETDKVSLEVNAPVAGTLSETLVEEGASVEVGAILARISEGAAGAAATSAPSEAVKQGDTGAGTATGTLDARGQAPGDDGVPAPAPALNPAEAKRTEGRVTASDLAAFLGQGAATSAMTLSPAVARLVEQHELDPYRIPATGPQGRLTKEDVEAVVEGRVSLKPKPTVSGGAPASPSVAQTSAKEPAPAEAPAAAPRERRERMSKLRQTIARRLKESQNNAAMLTTFNEADMSAVMELRSRYKDGFEKKHGVKLGFTAFFAKACVKALKEIPAVNARIDGTDIVYNEFYDIGMAVSAPQGLMVPVIRDCDGKSFAEIEKALGDLAGRARDGKLGLDEMQGGSFTITNGGVFGSLVSTPILNAPQSGILGLHKIQERPVAIAGKVEVRPMMYLALSYDHRIVDGREAVTFLVKVKEAIEDPERLLLDL